MLGVERWESRGCVLGRGASWWEGVGGWGLVKPFVELFLWLGGELVGG